MLSFEISESWIVEISSFSLFLFNRKYGNSNNEKGKTNTSMGEILLVSYRKKEPNKLFWNKVTTLKRPRKKIREKLKEGDIRNKLLWQGSSSFCFLVIQSRLPSSLDLYRGQNPVIPQFKSPMPSLFLSNPRENNHWVPLL